MAGSQRPATRFQFANRYQCWREETPYGADSDFIFASARMHGRQPLWPEALMRNHIASAAKRAGIGRDAMYGLVRSGRIPFVKIGTHIKVPVWALEEWTRRAAQTPDEDD